jgi:hypothetical protein
MFDPKALGATSSLDVGIFLFGAGVGGIFDAILNVANSAEPVVFGDMCGAVVLGAKNIVAAWRRPSPPPDRSVGDG